MAKLKKGDRIRIKTRMMSGWKGIGIVAEDQTDDTVYFYKEAVEDLGEMLGRCCAGRHEVAKLRNQNA